MSRRKDLNLHPPGSKPGALPDCATPRRYAVVRDPPGVLAFPVKEMGLPCSVATALGGAADADDRRVMARDSLSGAGASRITGAYLRPDRGVHRVGSGRRRRRSERTGSGRPARGWNWSFDPWMLLAVFMTAFELLYVLPENAAVKRSIQKTFEYADNLRRAQWRAERPWSSLPGAGLAEHCAS